MNIKFTTEQEDTIKSMGSMCYTGKVHIDLETAEETVLHKQKTYWFMPCVFEETETQTEFRVHELPQSIADQIIEFINK